MLLEAVVGKDGGAYASLSMTAQSADDARLLEAIHWAALHGGTVYAAEHGKAGVTYMFPKIKLKLVGTDHE